MNYTKIVDITPDISLMPKLAYSGYSLPQAIAELIDNSIDSIDLATEYLLKINIIITSETIIIKDNGCGMNEKDLINAMTLAKSEKINKIGKFGLGLKTACLSLGSVFVVVTHYKGEEYEYKIVYDENRWLKDVNSKWTIKIKLRKVKNISKSYTKITIRNLKPGIVNLKEKLITDISQRYSPFIKSKYVNIYVNSERVKAIKHELIKGSKTVFEIDMNPYSTLFTKFLSNEKITGWYGILPEGMSNTLYGFTLFWRGRMISSYDKIAIGEHPYNSRITGEINLDFVPVTHNKREFIKTSEEYIQSEIALKYRLSKLIEAVKTLANNEAIQDVLKQETNDWLKKITKAFLKSRQLKELSLFSELGVSYDNMKKGGDIISTDEDKSEKKDKREKKEPINKKEKMKEDKSKKEPKHKIKIKGKTFEFIHKYLSLGENASWKSYEIDDNSGLIKIYTNIDFPAFNLTKDKAFYAVILISEVLSEVFIQKIGVKEYSISEIKELLIRETCKIDFQTIKV